MSNFSGSSNRHSMCYLYTISSYNLLVRRGLYRSICVIQDPGRKIQILVQGKSVEPHRR